MKILARKQYSGHPGDSYLAVVLVNTENSDTSYATYVANLQSGGLAWGHYHSTLESALRDFNCRHRMEVPPVEIPISEGHVSAPIDLWVQNLDQRSDNADSHTPLELLQAVILDLLEAPVEDVEKLLPNSLKALKQQFFAVYDDRPNPFKETK